MSKTFRDTTLKTWNLDRIMVEYQIRLSFLQNHMETWN